ncbi:glycosyltransferase 1 domain-containing protein 1 isoform X2 [Protopterus annectens]|uniref:glycosyltransferase 1 domain-containing protein 1 isoform X2 n=1 Tax=Protopterus annectens TaxID=7888 RepID=UPI001CFC2D85|nr:glycosyltransferase 1 domain-containing protein 1 isoform X2 [Protopterus annectens]
MCCTMSHSLHYWKHIEEAGHTCILKEATAFQHASEVEDVVRKENVDAALAIHIYKGGRFLPDIGIPYGVIFGGTDINEDIKDEHKREVMGIVLLEARFAVVFTDKMKITVETYWPFTKNKIHVQPQGIITRPSTTLKWKTFLESSGIEQEEDNPYVFLLVCGLRHVKDPLYLMDAFSEWHQKEKSVHLVIIGPAVDPFFTKEVAAKVEQETGIHLVLEKPQKDLHAVMKKCFAVVNSSISEGMSATILEAMDLEVPVLARNIPGNAAIVKHGETGLLYSDPQEFVKLSKRLMCCPDFKKGIVSNAREYVKKHHSAESERMAYQRLILSLQ